MMNKGGLANHSCEVLAMSKLVSVQNAMLCLSLIAFSVSAPAALAQRIIISGFKFDPSPPSPTSVSWRLERLNGDRVEIGFHNIASRPLGDQIPFVIESDNAASMGVDFAAWSAAAIDPSYTRSIVTFGGVSMEEPFVAAGPEFRLERIFLFIDHWVWPPRFGFPTDTAIQFGLRNTVPEPTSLALVAAAMAVCSTARRRSE